MANSDKNIVITPNKNQSAQPEIDFTGFGNTTISLKVLDDSYGTLSFEGSAGQLFSISNNLTAGSIFSVNDVSGIPSIDVNANGNVSLGAYSSNVAIGHTRATSKLHVLGNSLFTSGITTISNLSSTNGVFSNINSSGITTAAVLVAGNGTALGSSPLVVNGTVGDNDSQLLIKKPSQSSFGVLAWNGEIYLSSNTYYQDGSWVQSAPSGDNDNQLFALSPGSGVKWYASNNGTSSWNVASDLLLWNDSGVWQRPLANTLTISSPLTGTSYNNSSAVTIGINATSANTANFVVQRDGSGNFSAGTITATLSGNSTTATTASNLSGFTNSNSSNPITADSVTNNGLAYVNTNISLYSQTDGALYSQAYSSNWIHQIYGDYRTGQIAIRGKNNGTWQSWRAVLDSSNYTSYAIAASSGTGNDIYNNGWFRNNDSGEGLYNQATALHWYSDSANYWNSATSSSTTGGIRFRAGYGSTIYGYVYHDTSGFGLLDSAGNWSYRTTTSSAEIYKTLYTRELQLQNYQIVNTGPITPYVPGGNSGWTRSSYPYSLGFQETGGWSYPYPDLIVQYHTGVTMAANSGYDGIRFKRDYNDDTLVFQINGGSNYMYKYNWLYTNTTGFYSDTNSAHIYPNTGSSYAAWRVDGNRNGYTGIWYSHGGVADMWDSGGNGGWYREGSGRWYAYYLLSNVCMGINTSTTSSSYGLYVDKGIYSTANIVAYSDVRKKENIVTVDNALDTISKLRGVFYNKIDDETKTRQIGVIAQEVEMVLPEVVTHAKDIDEYGVSYGNFAGLFIEAFKEQTEIINTLKEEIEILKSKLGE